MADEQTFTLTGVDRATGETVVEQLSAAEVERIMIAAEGLPDPNVVSDDERDD